MDSILSKIRKVFALGIEQQPGYQIADRIKMAIDTHKDIEKLPDTREEGINT